MNVGRGWGWSELGTVALLWVLFLLIASPAYAHARYERSEPEDGAVVTSAPKRVGIWFSQELFRREGENWIRVTGLDGAPAHSGEAVIDDDDRSHLSVQLAPPISPGIYRVEWRSLSAEDGDTAEGEFRFTYDPQASATSTPMLGPTTPRGSTTTSSETPATSTQVGGTSTPSTDERATSRCALSLVPALGLAAARLHIRPLRKRVW